MNEKQVIFQEATFPDGGIYFGREEIFVAIKNYANGFINRLRRENPTIPQIYFEFVNNNNLNAYAFKWKEQYFIGMFKGAVIQISALFDTIIKEKDFIEEFADENTTSNYLKDKLVFYCILFLITHEVSHIRFGHCDYSEAKGNIFMNELTSNEYNENDLESQTLEMDADCCAIATIINRMIHDTKGKNLEEKCGTAVKDLKLLNFSIYYLFKLFSGNSDVLNYDIETLRSYDHPHPGIRQCYISANIATWLIKYLGETELVNNICEEIVRTCFLSEKIYQRKVNKNCISLLLGYTPDGSQHINDIVNYWGVVRIKYRGLHVFPGILDTENMEYTLDFAHDFSEKPGIRKGLVRVIL